MIKAKAGEQLDAWLKARLPFLLRLRVHPHLWTLIGTAISIAAGAAFAAGALRWGGVLLLAGGFFDLTDGVVARQQKRTSTFGAFLDSTLDRFADMVVLLGIMMHYAASAQRSHLLLAGCALVASVMVSYAKARAERYVPHFEVGVMERGERVGLIAAGAILGFLVLALWIVLIGSIVTAAQRFALAYREMERIDALARGEVGGHTVP